MTIPKLSIITINYNNAVGLQKTLESVNNQTFVDYEYIIIDGGSTDGSRELIEKQRDKLTYWVSEKDTGIYNAMNKGIKASSGDYLIFLNSGDTLYANTTLEEIFKNNLHNREIIYGSACFLKNEKQTIMQFPEKLNMSFFMRDMICHQAMLFKKNIFEKHGIYDEKYKLSSDWLLLVKALYNNATYMRIDSVICVYDCQGATSSVPGTILLYNERRAMLDEYFKFISKDMRDLDKLDYEITAIRSLFIVRAFKKFKNIFRKQNLNSKVEG